jgi:hypothetical protein
MVETKKKMRLFSRVVGCQVFRAGARVLRGSTDYHLSRILNVHVSALVASGAASAYLQDHSNTSSCLFSNGHVPKVVWIIKPLVRPLES